MPIARQTSIELPTLVMVDKALRKYPLWKTGAQSWAGHCYEVATACVDDKLVPGVAVYGHFIGKIAPQSYFGKRHHFPFVQHGWVRLPDGRIFDATRWGFDGKPPYLYVGANGGEYDEGGNEFRRVMVREAPTFDPAGRVYPLMDAIKKVSGEDYRRVQKHVGMLLGEERAVVGVAQIFWLANLPYDMLGPDVELIYRAYEEMDQGAAIPIDNRRRAERESGR